MAVSSVDFTSDKVRRLLSTLDAALFPSPSSSTSSLPATPADSEFWKTMKRDSSLVTVFLCALIARLFSVERNERTDVRTSEELIRYWSAKNPSRAAARSFSFSLDASSVSGDEWRQKTVVDSSALLTRDTRRSALMDLLDTVFKGYQDAKHSELVARLSEKTVAEIQAANITPSSSRGRRGSLAAINAHSSMSFVGGLSLAEPQLRQGLTSSLDPLEYRVYFEKGFVPYVDNGSLLYGTGAVVDNDACEALAAGLPAGQDRMPRGELERRRFRASLLSTIYSTALFYRFEAHDPVLAKFRELWTETLTYSAVADEVLQELYEQAGDQAFRVVEMVTRCVSTTGMEGPSLPPPILASDAYTAAGVYALRFLKAAMVTGSDADVRFVYDTVSVLLSHPRLPGERLKTLLSFVKWALPQRFYHPAEELRELMQDLKYVYLLPGAYGSMARSLLTAIRQELLSAGSAYRSRMALLCAHSLSTAIPVSSPTMVSPAVDIVRDSPTLGRAVIFVNPLAARAVEFVAAMCRVQRSGTVHWLKACLWLNLVELLLGEDLSFFHRAQHIAPSLLAACYDQVAPLLSENGPPSDEARECCSRCKEHVVTTALPAAASEKMWEYSRNPVLPGIDFRFVIVLPEDSDISAIPRHKKTQPKLNMFHALEHVLGSMPDRQLRIAVAGGNGTLLRFLTGYMCLRKCRPELLEDRDLRFYVLPLGSYNGLPAVLASYDGWYGRYLFVPLQFQVNALVQPALDVRELQYALTSTDSDLGMLTEFEGEQTIAKTLVPSPEQVSAFVASELVMTPRSDLPKLTAEGLRSVYDGPASMVRSLVQSYIRDAHYTLDVCLCALECSRMEVGQGVARIKDFFNISFCQQVELGVYAAAALHKAREGGEGNTLNDIIASRNFRYLPVPWRIKFRECDPTGKAVGEVELEPRAYTHVVVKNLTRCGDKGVMASPVDPWLEVFMLDTEARKKRSRFRETDLGENRHVTEVHINSDAYDDIYVLVDGELQGPFQKIRVSLSLQDGAPLRFPIQTFQPIEF